MAEDERPAKMRKLSHDAEPQVGEAAASLENGARSEDQSKRPFGKAENHHSESRTHISFEARGAEQESTNKADHHDDASSADESLPLPGETAPIANSGEVVTDGPPMSKNQLKKLRKKQEWESKRDERKIIRKEKTIAKRERRRAAKQQEIAENGDRELPRKQSQQSVQLPITFLIDCDFDDLMRDNERISLASQITRCYSDNKGSSFRAHLTVCSFLGKLRERFDNILTHYKHWRGMRFLDCDFVEAAKQAKEWMVNEKSGGKLTGPFAKYAGLDESAVAKLKADAEVVYLSSEANDTLTELKPYSTYIIGGLVDKNREKGICYKRARQKGVKTARLPIGDYLEMSSRKVLATNHVNEIMVRWLECGDWGEAFMKVIPKRKGGKLRGEAEDGEAKGEDDEDGKQAVEAHEASQDAENGTGETEPGDAAVGDDRLAAAESEAAQA
ncbi:tRNA (guanine(9)-N1)-methyltransferase [Teratosphaeria destructans]|uniref:tRNA (guanine(9)-N1)-methyltransferase n=1 Tax=Teratosphaeria destructans TaxID=418781 RepID=A0A9W7STA3_9PEZI|nr:tRNA (guanine(9)-N1)-methyltransferase [Teratosphaeria destructans]